MIAGPQPEAIPGKPQAIARALRRLRGPRTLTAHLFLHYVSPKSTRSQVRKGRKLARRYHRHGFPTEFVLAYRAAEAPDVRGYVRFVRRVTSRLGSEPGVEALQVTNEANNIVAPDASDGSYEGAELALIRGVIAADKVTRRRGLRGLDLGFNWFYRVDPDNEDRFWSTLAAADPRFRRGLDWIGLDAYPGTFFPPATAPLGLAGDSGDWMLNALSTLRCFATDASISPRVPIHVTENGWPTSPVRSPAQQAQELREMVEAVRGHARNYNVTDYRWFSLRDSDSSQPDFQQQFGLLRDDYTPKPAFGVYRDLIRRFGR